MAIDRSKYRKASSEEMAQQNEEMEARKQPTNQTGFLKVEPGINKFRIFPAPLKAESSLFCFPKVTSFLPLLVDEYDDNGNKTGKQVEKRKAIFNAKVHGNLSIDIVEAYIEAAREKFSATIKDKKDLRDKLKPITDWKTGIKPSSSYIVYAFKYIGSGDGVKNKQYGRLQLTDGVKKQLDSLCLRQGDSGIPMVIDSFSDPDKGKPFQWSSNPNAEDAKARNKVNILFEEELPLTDEELEMLENWDALESVYQNSYTKSDFKKQVEGLQRFDKNNKLNIFDSPSFQSILESAKAEVEEKLQDKESKVKDEEDEEEVKNSSNKNSQVEEEEDTIPEVLEDMDKKTLMTLPELLELEVELKTTTPPSKMRKMIKEAIVHTYELEGTNSEINDSITDIISSQLEEKGNHEDNEPEKNDDNEEEEVEASPAKSQSLLDKYRKKKQ